MAEAPEERKTPVIPPDFLKQTLDLASEDPERFRQEVGILAKRLGITVSEVYHRLQADPDFARVLGKDALNRVLQAGAKKLREKLGI